MPCSMYMYTTTTFTKIISNQTPYTHRQINSYINTPPVVPITKKTPLIYTCTIHIPSLQFPDKHPATGHKVVRTRTKATPEILLGQTSVLAVQPRIRGQKRVGNRHLARYRGVRAKLGALSRVSCFPSVPLGAFPIVRVEYVVCLRWGTCDGSCWEKLR